MTRKTTNSARRIMTRRQTDRAVSSEAWSKMFKEHQVKPRALPVVLLLSFREDQVGDDEGRDDGEEWFPGPPEDVRKTLRDGSSEGPLFHWRQMVLGGSSHSNSEVTEAKASSDKGGSHCELY